MQHNPEQVQHHEHQLPQSYHEQDHPEMMTIRYVEESRISVAPEVRFNEWYTTPAELMDVEEIRRLSSVHITAAPWFNNFGSSSTLLKHLKTDIRAPQYGSAAARERARHRARESTLSFMSHVSETASDDTNQTNSSMFSGLMSKAKRASESISSIKQNIRNRAFPVHRVLPKFTACFCVVPDTANMR